jgi:flagellar motor switch protein FliM
MESEPKSDPQSADQMLRELPVEVVCELGRVAMSGRELLELRPGAIIPAGRPLSGPVDLTVGGRIVARGELVDVEGEIGVRITQMCE